MKGDFFVINKKNQGGFRKKTGHTPPLCRLVSDSGPHATLECLVSGPSVHNQDLHRICTLEPSYCTSSMYAASSSTKVIVYVNF